MDSLTIQHPTWLPAQFFFQDLLSQRQFAIQRVELRWLLPILHHFIRSNADRRVNCNGECFVVSLFKIHHQRSYRCQMTTESA